MKKIYVLLLAVAMMLSLVACSSGEASSVDVTTKQAETSEVVETTTADITEAQSESDIKYADLIPNPESIFPAGSISIVDPDGGKAYILQVTNYEDEEYETYISKCKELGFTDISNESDNEGGKMFAAYTEDGKYWVEVLLGNETKIIAITCKASSK